nr:hypothetical protein [Bacteroidota bacterium]
MALISKHTTCLKWNPGLFLILFFTAPYSIFAQQIHTPDHVVYNQLTNFLIEYENMINEEDAFDESGLSYVLGNYFYNEKVELFNDLDKGKAYLTWNEYRNKALQMSADCYMDFRYYDLKISKRNHYRYFDIIQANLVKEIKYACGNSDTLKVKRLNVDITLIYYKYRVDDTFPRFRILRMDLEGQSFKPDSWYQCRIPDELWVNISPLYNIPILKQSGIELDRESQWGYQAGIGTNWLITGGLNDILVFSGGIGYTKTSSVFKLNYYEAVIHNDVDKDGDTYDREIYGKDLKQTLNYSTVDIPLMLSWRHLMGKNWQLALSTGLQMSYLIDQNYKTDGGEFEYRGLYHDLYGQEFYFFNLPSYGFTTYPSNNTSGNDPKLNDFIFSWQSSIHASYKIANYFNLFFGPSFSLGLNNLVENTPDDYVVSKYTGATDPLVNLADGFKMMSVGFEAGLRFTLNDISRPFIKTLKFKGDQRDAQKINHKQYIQALFSEPGDPDYQQGSPGKSEKQTEKVHLKGITNNCLTDLRTKPSLNDIPYANRGVYEVQNTLGNAGSNSAIKMTGKSTSDPNAVLSGKGLYLYKPYGFNITDGPSTPYTKLGDSIYYLPIGSSVNQLDLIPVPPLNIYIYNVNDKTTDNLSSDRDKVYNKYFSLHNA